MPSTMLTGCKGPLGAAAEAAEPMLCAFAGWATWAASAEGDSVNVQVSAQASLECSIENLTNVDYRVHGSGSNSLGTNVVLGMRVTF